MCSHSNISSWKTRQRWTASGSEFRPKLEVIWTRWTGQGGGNQISLFLSYTHTHTQSYTPPYEGTGNNGLLNILILSHVFLDRTNARTHPPTANTHTLAHALALTHTLAHALTLVHTLALTHTLAALGSILFCGLPGGSIPL